MRRRITIAIGSCFFLADADPRWGGADYGGEYEIFDAIAAAQPDLMLWLGDNLYLQRPDFLDPASMAARYRRQRAFEPLQRLLTAAPQLAIWDDHDYGPNDSDASYVLKGETLKLFQRYWPNPSYGLPDVPGAFGFAQYGDVLLFLLDDRYYRSPNRWPDGPDKTMFGAAPARVAQAGADLRAAQQHQDHRRRQPVLEPRQPVRRLEPLPDRAAGLRRLARAAEDRRRDLPVRRPPLRRAPAHRASRRATRCTNSRRAR